VLVRERDPAHAVVNEKDDDGGDVVNKAEGIRLLYSREEDSPEEYGYDDLKGEGRAVEEDPPLPQEPWRIDLLVVLHHRFLCLVEKVLPKSENGEEAEGGCGEEDTPIREVDQCWSLI